MFRDLVRCNQDQLEQIGQTSRGIVGSD
jgi:hypothetical protein